MNEQQAHELLQCYFDGATSLDEERALQCYFAQNDVPTSLKAYQPMFAFFAQERAVQPPVRKSATRIRWGWYALAGMAASIAILLVVGSPKAPSYAYYVDGQRVYNQTAAVESAESKLQMLAASMQKARSSMATFEAVQEGGSSLQQLGKIASAYQMIEEKLQETTFKN